MCADEGAGGPRERPLGARLSARAELVPGVCALATWERPLGWCWPDCQGGLVVYYLSIYSMHCR